MTSVLEFKRDGWLNSEMDDPETRTVTRLRVSILGDLITRNLSKRGGGESEAINTSIFPLAEFLANNWWSLLNEPVKPAITETFRVRHRLDSGMRGYSFPALALWSGGEGSVVADWAAFENPFSQISFLTSAPNEPVQLDRASAEASLMDLVETALERAGASGGDLAVAWERVRETMANQDELNYCIAAGRLGLDPYDPDAPDLSDWARGISETLFNDVADIVDVSDLQETSDWIREKEARLAIFPETNLEYFGTPAADDLADPAWVAGQVSAERLRAHTGLPLENPRQAINDLLGSVIADGNELSQQGPDGISALLRRDGFRAHIGTVAKRARQRRFRACAATYLAWTSRDGDEHAVTDALTRRQQASRSFAAEMLAPREALLARSSKNGFDGEDLEEIAGEFICPYETVMWQAVRAHIPLRGITLPSVTRSYVVTQQPSGVA